MPINTKTMLLMFLTAAVPSAGILYAAKSGQAKKHENSVAEIVQEAESPTHDIEYNDEPKVGGLGWDSPYIPPDNYATVEDTRDANQDLENSSQSNPAFDAMIKAAERAEAAAQDAEDAATRAFDNASNRSGVTEKYENGVRQYRP